MKQDSTINFAGGKTALMVRIFTFILLTASILVLGFAGADAAPAKKKKASKPAENPRYSAIIVDAQTGEVLMGTQADSIRHPASLTKMMTLYLLFEAMEQGRVRMGDRITVSSHAASMSPSKLGIPAGGSVQLEDAILSIVTKSANDIAAAVGERIGGSERNFASRMTRKAHDLGMSRTIYRNASGLPDPQQVTTARDQAKLAMALLRDFPNQYHYFGVRNFEWRGAILVNHNRLLGEYPGLDGIKTGYINASGFNLVASAKQNGRRLVGVVFGGTSWHQRNATMVKLLDTAFDELRSRRDQTRMANINSPAIATAPIPKAPPMSDDMVRGAPQQDEPDDATDIAEDAAVGDTTPATPQLVSNMIEKAQIEAQQSSRMIAAVTPAAEAAAIVSQPLASPAASRPAPVQIARISPPPAADTSDDDDILRAAIPQPRRVPAAVVAKKSAPEAKAQPAKAAAKPSSATSPTVMQLRIPRSQLPAGIPESQIVATKTLAPGVTGSGWAIQVGAFPSRAMTDQALRTAQSRLPNQLQQGQPVIVPQNTASGLIFRARLQGYNEIEANAACAQLGSCLVVAPGS